MAREPGNPFTGASPALVDLIGTLGVSLMTVFGPYTTAWAKVFSPRLVIAIGGLLFGVACILASFGTALWHFELTQGVLLGIGTCLAYMPAVTVAPTWYDRRRGLAMGIIMAGTGVGGVVWAPVTTSLIDHLGYRNALRVSGGITGALIIVASIPIKWDPTTKIRLERESAQRRRRNEGLYRSLFVNIKLLDMEVAKSRVFVVQIIGTFLQAAAYYTPVFFFSAYARSIGFSTTAGANFIALSNATNAIGKIVIGLIADRYGRWNTLFIVTFFSGISTFGLWLSSTLINDQWTSQALFITYTALYGIFASPYVSLFPAGLVDLFGPANFANVNGALYVARGFATLMGTPVAGALIREAGESLSPRAYWRPSVFVGALLLGSAGPVFYLGRFSRKRAQAVR
ncbi:uncharacterized protein I303_106662 [Kwoniella dejecticola CBS 10117]|uniref:Major facilitator superfamily (MFS) profile domain-containing protein n=1 Tax=Kwoniella dejecticola CBS 10117 TaxID=1296121 RepID=A0A1A5ZU24_9TREE|nr:uncharacterized protein I303_08695 [Kwoniella dejecticola CBS 10117]OBR81309.1 hypothetical protein I303_08695 [Kwoniella dejecticola CBS 10117]